MARRPHPAALVTSTGGAACLLQTAASLAHLAWASLDTHTHTRETRVMSEDVEAKIAPPAAKIATSATISFWYLGGRQSCVPGTHSATHAAPPPSDHAGAVELS